MDKHKMNYIFYFVVAIIVLFTVSLCIVLLSKKIIKNGIKEDDVLLISSFRSVEIRDKISVSDQFGRSIVDDNDHSFGYAEFEVSNTLKSNRDFQLYVTDVTDVENNKLISPSYIKFYLVDEDNNPLPLFSRNKLPSFVDLNYISDKPDSKLLYEGSLKGNESKKYTLRVWITDNYIASNSDKIFSFEIGVRAV